MSNISFKRLNVFLINIYVSFCIKDFDKAKLERKSKENVFCTGFFEKQIFPQNFNFYGFSRWALTVGRRNCISVRKFWTICIMYALSLPSARARWLSKKNNKIHYRTVIRHLNIVNRRTDFFAIKMLSKQYKTLLIMQVYINHGF